MRIDKTLLEKYNKPGPRYTSYPPATMFGNGYTSEDLIKDIRVSNISGSKNISLYIHIPFCPQLCHFCGCNTMIGKKEDLIGRYISALKKEILMYAPLLDKSRKITQIHWGGGTPNSISMSYISDIMSVIKENFTLSHKCEIAMECSPAYLEFEHIETLHSIGFNRLSLGIQDFNENVLEIINRRPSKHPVKELVKKIKETGFESVNIDLVYGLPGQTIDSFMETVEKAIDISPDRLVTFSYAHVPWVKGAQKQLEKHGLPSSEDKMSMLEMSMNLLNESGYNTIGMDHYAKPDDELYKALEKKKLHRNFQGYCTKETTGQVYAFGSSSINQLRSAYSQNEKNVHNYIEKVEKGEFPLAIGYSLTKSDIVCREVINEIMCNGYLDIAEVSERLSISTKELKEIVDYDPDTLKKLEDDGLISIENDTIKVNETGLLFVRNIAMAFDPKLTVGENKFSKTV